MDSAVAQLAIDRLTVVPFTIHPVFDPGVSFSVVVDYNTISRASFFLKKFSSRDSALELPGLEISEPIDFGPI